MKFAARTVCFAIFIGLFSIHGLWALDTERAYMDAYSSASDTKTMLTGPAFDAAAGALQAGSSALISAAEAQKTGQDAGGSGTIGNVMSTNPDGSVGVSTISEWVYARGGETDTVMLQLTEGQNALNLAEAGRRGTLFISDLMVDGKSGRYFVHLKVVRVDILKYSDEAFAEGKFNAHYSGKAKKKSQYTLTCDVLAIEEVSSSVKLGFKMP